ncbi:MAG: hypothetical protein ACOXZR_02220 [Bacilli bacterium]
MRKEQLRMNEQKKYEIIKKLVEQGEAKIGLHYNYLYLEDKLIVF